MMEENGSKKVLLSVLGVAILVVAVVGISFAAYSATRTSDANTISTGTISMSYSEPTNGIELVNALPMSDDNGKKLTGAVAEKNQTFEFTVSTNASAALNIPYEISVTPVAITATESLGVLTDRQVKVYLTKKADSTETEVVAPTLVSALAQSTVEGRSTSKLLYKTTDQHAGNDVINTNYVLRMWIDNAVSVDDITDKTYEYRLKVNVDAAVAPLA